MDYHSRVTTLGRYFNDLRLILLCFVLGYIVVYFAIPGTPGNVPNAHPIGWWDWFDQGNYLLSANAMAQFDFAPSKHFYPPLYPAIGAFFLKWSSGHMFFVINLFSLLWFAFVFVRFADGYIPRWGSVVLLFWTTILDLRLFVNYVIPWTSTLSVALLASGILGLVWIGEIEEGIRSRISGLQVFFVATCLGLLVPTRPADAVVGGLIGFGLLIGYLRVRRKAIKSVPHIGFFLVLAMTGAIIGPLLFLGFNILVFGTPTGGYIQVAGANGFFFADLSEKFISLFLDSFTLYGEPKAALTHHYPWLFIGFAGLLWVVIRGDIQSRSVAFGIVLFFLLYLPYGDLLPNGLWRYQNIHYFKWIFPFLALFTVLIVKQVLVSWRQKEGRAVPFILLFGVSFLLLSLHFVVEVTPVSIRANNNQTDISFELPNKKIDFVDFKGLTGEFTDVYFGEHRLLLDDRELKMVPDYRLLPMKLGVRLIFIRPVLGRSVKLFPDKRLIRHSSRLGAQIGNYRFALGALKPFRQLVHPEIVIDYHVGEIINFSQKGSGELYTTQGWSSPEEWGRWSVNDGAGIQMRLTDHADNRLVLELFMSAFVSKSHPCQEIGVTVNERELARKPLCIGKGGETPSTYKFLIPRELLRPDGKINIRLDTPDSISPKTLRINADDRVLGVGVRSLKLSASENQDLF
jgi:hypothetical protein